MTANNLDPIDLQILQCLLEDATVSHKEIGAKVHLTGQAVGARVRKLEDLGVIEGYTLKWNPERIGKVVTAFVTVFMKSTAAHQSFQAFVRQQERIEEAHRISGEGCYWLRVRTSSHEELNEFLGALLEFGNYRLNLSIGKLKS